MPTSCPLIRLVSAAVLLIAAFIVVADIPAAVLTWDGNGAAAPNPNGGAGTWNANSNTNWWNGAANVVWPNTGTDNDALFANTAGTVAISGTVAANELTFTTTGYTIQSGTLTLNGTTPTITTDPGVGANITSTISGSAGLAKAGGGTLTLIGTAPLGSYTGATNINAGTLKISLANAVSGWNSAVTVNSNTTLELNSTGTTTVDSTRFNNAGLSFSGAGTITKTGTGYFGMMLSNGLQNFAGLVDVQEGTLGNNGTGWGAGPGLMDLNIASGATLDMRTGNIKIDALTGGATAKITSSHIIGVILTLGNNNATAAFDGTINNGASAPLPGGGNAGTISLIKAGNGTQTLNGVNTYTGATTINANSGTLEIGGAGSLNSGSYAGTISLGANSTLRYNSSAAQTFSGSFTGTGTLIKDTNTSVLTLGPSSLGHTGATTINAGTLKINLSTIGGLTAIGWASAVNIGSSGTLELNGSSSASVDNVFFNNAALAFTGSGTITKTGTGYIGMQLSNGVKNFSGLIDVQQGIWGNNGTGWGAGAGLMDLNIASGATLDMRTGNIKIDALTGGATAKITSSHNQAVNLSLGNNGGSGVYNGGIHNGATSPLTGGANSGIISLTKVGSGTQTLSGANTYSGTTTVNGGVLNITGTHAGNGAMNVNAGGTLLINGVKTGTGAITVANNATLGGHGTLSGATTIQSGGTLSPGASPGVITFNNSLTLQSGAEVYFEGNDLIVVNGLLTLPSTWVLDLTSNSTNWVYDASRWTVLFDYNTASLAGGWDAWSNIFFPSLPFDTSLVTLVNDTASGEIRLMGMYAVPEPSCCLLAALGLIGIACCARRRRSH